MNERRIFFPPCFTTGILFSIVLILLPSFASDQQSLARTPMQGNTPLSYAESFGMKKPVVRIGVSGDERKITVSSSGVFKIIETATGLDVWKESYSGEIFFLPFGTGESNSKIFRVQIGSFENKEQAELLRRKVEAESGFPAIVKYYPDRRIYRVRVGEGTSQNALVNLASRLKQLGYAEQWISEELPEWKGDIFIRIVDEEYVSEIVKTNSLVVFPVDPSSLLSVNGKSYRGYIEIKVYSTGALQAINILNIEEYLKGVVPLELGPELWPELEALKAQAVAARTYIYKNLGQFEEEGFDLCDSVRCQVYGGRDAEHPVSNRAVKETYGQVAVFEGAPINALYTSTCGGMTEDGTNMFEEEKGAYLKAVECYPDQQSLASRTYTISSSREVLLDSIITEVDLLRNAALMIVHGIISEDFVEREWDPKGKMKSHEILQLLLKAAEVTGIEQREPLKTTVENVSEFWQAAARVFSIDRRANLQISDKDTEILLQSLGEYQMHEEERRLLAYIVREGFIGPELCHVTFLKETMTQGYLITSLANIMRKYEGFKLGNGSFRMFEEPVLSFVSNGNGDKRVLSKRVFLFNIAAESAFPVDAIKFIPGEKFFYHLDREGRIDYLEKKPPVKGSSNDRYSIYYTWQISRSREELQESINQKIPVGELIDIQEVRRGKSGRIVEMQINGGGGEFIVKGLKIRNALQLKENLFTMDKKRNPDGSLHSITFSGKGWGHGVGLCQVGAYGMALRGKSYDEILKWYYTGIELIQAYD